MTTIAESLLEQALRLSDKDREMLYVELGSSLGETADDLEGELSDGMKAELDRRWEDIESGKVKCRDFNEVIAELRGRLNAGFVPS